MPSQQITHLVKAIDDSEADNFTKLYIYLTVLDLNLAPRTVKRALQHSLPNSDYILWPNRSFNPAPLTKATIQPLIAALNNPNSFFSVRESLKIYWGCGSFNDIAFLLRKICDLWNNLDLPKNLANQRIYKDFTLEANTNLISAFLTAAVDVFDTTENSMHTIKNGAVASIITTVTLSILLSGTVTGMGAFITLGFMAGSCYFVYEGYQKLTTLRTAITEGSERFASHLMNFVRHPTSKPLNAQIQHPILNAVFSQIPQTKEVEERHTSLYGLCYGSGQ